MRGAHIGNDGVFETTNLGFPLVAAIKKGDLFLLNKLVKLFGCEVSAATEHTVFINAHFVGHAKAHKFVANLHRKLGKICGITAFAPFEVDVFEGRIFAGFPPIFLDGT